MLETQRPERRLDLDRLATESVHLRRNRLDRVVREIGGQTNDAVPVDQAGSEIRGGGQNAGERPGRVARLRGGVNIVDRERRVRADSLVYWFDEDRAMAFGNVNMVCGIPDSDISALSRSSPALPASSRACPLKESRAADEGQPAY